MRKTSIAAALAVGAVPFAAGAQGVTAEGREVRSTSTRR